MKKKQLRKIVKLEAVNESRREKRLFNYHTLRAALKCI